MMSLVVFDKIMQMYKKICVFDMGLVIGKPVYAIYQPKRASSDGATVQSDQRRCFRCLDSMCRLHYLGNESNNAFFL